MCPLVSWDRCAPSHSLWSDLKKNSEVSTDVPVGTAADVLDSCSSARGVGDVGHAVVSKVSVEMCGAVGCTERVGEACGDEKVSVPVSVDSPASFLYLENPGTVAAEVTVVGALAAALEGALSVDCTADVGVGRCRGIDVALAEGVTW